MATAIVVHSPFAAYSRGQVVTDADTVKTILAGDHAGCVHRISLPDAAPAPTKATEPTPTVAEAVAAGVAAAEAALHPAASK